MNAKESYIKAILMASKTYSSLPEEQKKLIDVGRSMNEILMQLSKTKENKLYQLVACRAFLHLLLEMPSMDVIDEMFVHYEKVISDQQKIIEEFYLTGKVVN